MRHLRLSRFAFVRQLPSAGSFLGSIVALGLVAFTVGPACVTPGSGIMGQGGMTGSAGTTGSGGTGNVNPQGMGGAANEVILTGTAGAGGTGVAKMSCTAPPMNYGYTPGYQISANAVNQANSALASLTPQQRADQLRGTNRGNNDNWNDIFRTPNVGSVQGFTFRDGPRGVNLLAENTAQGYSTTFPAPVARGASFDLALEYEIARAMGDEMVASRHTMMLAPTTNILRHPLWGRAQETYGEDAFHLGRIGSAYTVGIQEYVPTCVKHYAANNIEVNRERLNAQMDAQTLREVYARHYEMMIQDAGVSCVMASYNAVNGTKATQNAELLNTILRTEFGFQGFVMTDWWAMPPGSSSASTDQLRTNAGQALKAGLDMELPWNYNFSQLEALVSAGTIAQGDIDKAALRVLREKYRFNVGAIGQFGLKAATTTWNSGTNSIGNNDAHIDLARRAAVEGSVLLKNDNNTLPIASTVRRIAVIGANVPWALNGSGLNLSGAVNFATDIRVGDFGSSRVQPDPAKTVGPFAGIQALAQTKGITVTSSNQASAADSADFVVVVAGLTFEDEGEEYTGAADRPNFSLDPKHGEAAQDDLIAAVAAKGKPMVVVLEGGGVIEMPWLSMVPAVVMAWYPGQMGGTAIAQLLFGTDGTNPVNFSGKLPVTWSTTGWPTFNDGTTTTMAYHLGYRRFDAMNVALNPAMGQFPYGHGLSYTTYRYENVQVPCSDVTKTAAVPVSVEVFNTGSVKGTEVVFLWVTYVDPPPNGVMRSIKELKGFHRVDLEPGQGKRVTIPLRASDLKVYSPTTRKMEIYSGRVKVMVGPSADKAKLLPSSDTDTSTTFTVLP